MNKKVAKKKTNIEYSNGTNTLTKVVDEYMDMFSFRKCPVSEAFLDHLATELVDWAKNDDKAIKVTQFLGLKGIHSKTFDRWRDRHPKMQDAYEYALMVIGDRRESGAIYKKFDASIVSFTMPHYDKDWVKQHEWRAKLKETEQQSNETRIVVLEKYPDSPMVPKKKEDK